jgi:hypothetical protein
MTDAPELTAHRASAHAHYGVQASFLPKDPYRTSHLVIDQQGTYRIF